MDTRVSIHMTGSKPTRTMWADLLAPQIVAGMMISILLKAILTRSLDFLDCLDRLFHAGHMRTNALPFPMKKSWQKINLFWTG